MKNWWLNLYTIPSLIVTARSTAIVFAIAMLINNFVPTCSIFVGWISCYIVFSQIKFSNSHFGINLNFHKLHIPLKELKRCVMLDGFIRVFAIFLGSFVCNGYIYLNGGYENIEIPLFVLAPIGFQIFFASLMTSVNSIVNGKYKYVLIDFNKMNKYLFVFVTACVTVITSVVITIFSLYGFNPVFVMLFYVAGFFIQHRIFIYRAAFHEVTSIGTYKRYFKSLGIDLSTGLGLYLVVALLSFPLIQNHSVNIEIRKAAFQMVGGFTPNLDNETAKDLIGANRYAVYNLEYIFKSARSLGEVPLSEILDKPRMSEYVTYLENVENPSMENLMYIMNNPIEKNKRNAYLYPELNKLIVDKWPKSQKFPEHLLAKQIELEKRAPASTENQK